MGVADTQRQQRSTCYDHRRKNALFWKSACAEAPNIVFATPFAQQECVKACNRVSGDG
jgi:hypothetical protein